MIRHLRITLNGRLYEVDVEEVAVTPGATATPTSAATTTMTPMPGPFVPPTKAAAVTAHAPVQSAPAVGGPDDRLAPLGGVIYEISVMVGDVVALDQPLLVLEAMKMKTVVGAHKSGRIAAIMVSVGDAVDSDQPLVKIV
jgi:glutaconyl-CoA/methylmalonyl-CoA decarboxylase subunit gamma